MLALGTLAGCERQDPTSSGPVSDNAKAVLTFASSTEHHYLDPQKISWLHDFRVAELLFTPLVRWSLTDMTLEPAAAAKWEISDDQLTYTFHLRPDGKWSNGDPVTARDFVYAWRRALLPDMAADYSQLLYCIEGAQAFFEWRSNQIQQIAQGKLNADQAWQQAIKRFDETVAIKAGDDHTLVVKLASPTPYFLQLCAFVTFFPVHEASLSKLEKVSASTGMIEYPAEVTNYWSDPAQLVSNGPYMLKSRRFRRDLEAVPNPHYFDRDKVANGGWIEVISTNPQTQLIEFRQGKIDWLPDIPTVSPLAADLVNQKLPTVHVSPAAATYFYNFNCLPTLPDGRKNPLADARVRRALSLAIDRQTIVDRVSRLGQPIARTFIPPGVIKEYQSPSDAGHDYNIELARQLLAEAGYPGGKGLTGLSILYNTGQGHENPAQQIKRTWEETLGVVVELEAYESKRFSELLKGKQYTISRASWFGDYIDPSTFLDKFQTDGGNNDNGWSNTQYDALLRQAAVELDPARRMTLFTQAETILLNEAPIAPIFQYVNLDVYDTRLKGMSDNPWKLRRLDLVSRSDR